MQGTDASLMPRQTRGVLVVPGEGLPGNGLTSRSSATEIMTDFDRVPAVTVDPGTQIDEALRIMQSSGVRAAVVVDGGSNVLGLVTAYDILGEKPARHMESIGCTLRNCRRADVSVADIMEPVERWWVIDVHDLARCTVGDVVETLADSGRTHIVVVERTAWNSDRLRGLISAAEAARRTGVRMPSVRRALTFTEIEQVVEQGELP